MIVKTATDVLRLTVCGPTAIHVVASPDGKAADATPQRPWILSPCSPAKFTFSLPSPSQNPPGARRRGGPPVATLDTGALRVEIGLNSGSLDFKTEQGAQLLEEFPYPARIYEPVTANGEALYRVTDSFHPQVREGLYGLGQHQNGVFNYRGTTVELAQANTDVAIPLLVSTQGYGIFWNTPAKSYFDNRFATEMNLSAEAAHAIDYYFFYGPEIDGVIHQYRALTGHAPLFGEWAYGFVQSKDRYKSSDELLKIAGEYRSQHVPLDLLVQDWFWWARQGDPEFNPSYPDVPGTLAKLHDEHIHTMISVWPVLSPQSNNYRAMLAKGYIIPGTTDYDATNPAAGDFYWNNLVGKLFAQGWDAFWLDSSEPEGAGGFSTNGVLADKKLFLGNGALYTNIFPFEHTGNVYRHWRDTTDRKRVLLLTRSGFAGQQRNAAITWSGDIYSTYLSFTRQIPAGLNFALSGMPYWTTDIAGYGPPYARDTEDPAYQKLYVRWFEFGVFCPILRTHGHRSNDQNELFSYGPQTPTLIAYDKLRYRLLPYTYSLAWKVTSEDGTIMRPLVMDWRTDEKVWNIGDQFMFGPSILVNPVTEEDATSRWLYLPPAAAWYDFWTGKKLTGDQRIEADAPLDRIPLYVKAGSILPLGPEVEYAGEKPDAPLDLRVYRGADGSFNLYEDAGDTYDYEKGQHSLIPIRWDDASHTLTIGAREGQFPGMQPERTFRLVLVSDNHGVGGEESANFDREIRYDGGEVSVTVP
ncbi:MAG TPA: TIM-barrel domain-containing protein [Acidobacteriaceae bacterium]|nr:TIM-barrel domain-containing protein [Acidobacteriaceae bacterium]